MKTTKRWRDETRKYLNLQWHGASTVPILDVASLLMLLDDADELESLQECFHCGGDVTICKAKCER